ncbi:hypothetical protein EVG20_g10106 [Dentipellis fragilis]|uniref:Uncharacterized protein n=1 Tax=Dentipellis fragilis TaxID=205917 RepID=A0A4Y9XTS6_9AGAM|nr:hypothetical protein EVG20_g10106 [Dentipellis fragilis]
MHHALALCCSSYSLWPSIASTGTGRRLRLNDGWLDYEADPQCATTRRKPLTQQLCARATMHGTACIYPRSDKLEDVPVRDYAHSTSVTATRVDTGPTPAAQHWHTNPPALTCRTQLAHCARRTPERPMRDMLAANYNCLESNTDTRVQTGRTAHRTLHTAHHNCLHASSADPTFCCPSDRPGRPPHRP